MRADDVRRVLVIGSGTMGLQIGLQVATHDCDVILHDADPAALDRAQRRLRSYGEAPVAAGSIGADQLEQALARIECTADPAAAAAEADVVSESVPEDPVLKGRVLGQFNELCPERAVLRPTPRHCFPRCSRPLPGGPIRA